ncbi:MAG: hypothetical protein NZ942_00955, partial [Candidatus Aenigmarchaeota archaeon]|nr:hypothetical protein [Candidatus Aenigmarchaeota archaeon]
MNNKVKKEQRTFNKRLQEVRKEGFVRLFEYIEEVGKIIGRNKALKILEKIVTKKRLNWLDKNKCRLRLKGNLLDLAYKIFYKEYLGLSSSDGRIVEKTENKLVTRWRNFCPVLEACKVLKLETKEICKKVYDKPTQKFLEKIHPRLR